MYRNDNLPKLEEICSKVNFIQGEKYIWILLGVDTKDAVVTEGIWDQETAKTDGMPKGTWALKTYKWLWLNLCEPRRGFSSCWKPECILDKPLKYTSESWRKSHLHLHRCYRFCNRGDWLRKFRLRYHLAWILAGDEVLTATLQTSQKPGGSMLVLS